MIRWQKLKRRWRSALSPPKDPLDSRESKKRRRERLAIIIGLVIFVALTFTEIRLSRLSAKLPLVNSIFFFGLLNVNICILIAIVWLVSRNIGKLFFERRNRVLGARLKTKLVVAFLAFSITPTVVLFIISSLYINSSFDKWFSIKIQNTLQSSLDITGTYYRNIEQTAMHFASHIASQIGRNKDSIVDPNWLRSYLDDQRELLALSAIEYYDGPLSPRTISRTQEPSRLPSSLHRLSLDLLDKAFSGETTSIIQHVGTGDLIRCMAPVKNRFGKTIGVVAVSSYIGVSLVNKVDEIASVFDDYKDTNPLKYPIKTAYFVILIMITLVILFVAIWIGLFIARELTVPVERLVYGAAAVGSGNLDIQIEGGGSDEIGVLVESFNKMTADLKENRKRLSEANINLQNRKVELEAVLANVGTGVLVVNKQGVLTTLNRAASQLLRISSESALGRKYTDVLEPVAGPLKEVIERAFLFQTSNGPQQPQAEIAQWTLGEDADSKSLAAIASPLRKEDETWGVVAVIDDMTHLIKAQREVAWREVARRIAHEIKNPLTPIKLSAQRLQRRLSHLKGKDSTILDECTTTIVQQTDELKEMVNEFSQFARLPETKPTPHQLNSVLQETLTLFSQAHPEIRFIASFEPRVPIFEFDRDQIKRVIVNLLDNSVAAIQADSQIRNGEIRIESHFNEQLQMVVVTVSDNGPGMNEEIRSRVFEPYFSTKKGGTGLGLAIAKRIINDHNGFIRIQSSPGTGSQFFIELPTQGYYDLKPM